MPPPRRRLRTLLRHLSASSVPPPGSRPSPPLPSPPRQFRSFLQLSLPLFRALVLVHRRRERGGGGGGGGGIAFCTFLFFRLGTDEADAYGRGTHIQDVASTRRLGRLDFELSWLLHPLSAWFCSSCCASWWNFMDQSQPNYPTIRADGPATLYPHSKQVQSGLSPGHESGSSGWKRSLGR